MAAGETCGGEDRLFLCGRHDFSAAATTRHLQRERGAHQLMFGGLVIAMRDGWELSLSAGHCVTRHEPWLMRSVIGFGF